MSKATLLELAGRVEKTSGPDTLLDCEIRAAVEGWKNVGGGYREWPDGRRERYNYGFAKPYSSSLDAAMTLVPDGAGVSLNRYWLREGERWSANLSWGVSGEHATAQDTLISASALTAACLRARAQQEPSDAR